MKRLLPLLCLLPAIAIAEPLSWFWRVNHYRVPLPQVAGWALIYEKVNIHNGEVDMADRVAGIPLFKTIAECSRAQQFDAKGNPRIERPDAQGFVRVYFCRALPKWPKGTETL